MMRRILLLAGLLLGAAGLCAQEQPAQQETRYGVVNLSVCNMRRTPDFDAEMISQALLGTPVHVLDEKNWFQIQSPDTYTGWVHRAGIHLMTKEQYHEWNAAEKVVVTALQGIAYSKPSTSSDPVSDLAGGDRVKFKGLVNWFYEVEFPDGRIGYIPRNLASKESIWRENLRMDTEAILQTARSMTGFPYIWAGMSPKGMDCSGYVRTVLFLHDIIIPRDAGPQSRVGKRIEHPDDFQPGDLIFFGKRDPKGVKDRVSHVAIYLGNKEFIHSIGIIKVGSFDPESPVYDEVNTGRMLYASRILPYINKQEGLNTTLTNPYYTE